MVTAWLKSTRVRAWASYCQGLEAPWPLSLDQKDTQGYIKLHKIPRDGIEHGEREADSQGTGDIIKRYKSFENGRVMGC